MASQPKLLDVPSDFPRAPSYACLALPTQPHRPLSPRSLFVLRIVPRTQQPTGRVLTHVIHSVWGEQHYPQPPPTPPTVARRR